MGRKMSRQDLIAAVYEARRRRLLHPEGEFDKGGRWYPSEREDCGVSSSIRSPSRRWPYSYMVACRTKKHVKALAEAQPEYFQAEARRALEVLS